MPKLTIALLMAAGLAVPALAQIAPAMSRDAYDAEKDRIETAYKTQKGRCDAIVGGKQAACEEAAKAQHDIAMAELDARMRNTPEARRDAARKRAEAEFNLAKGRCEELASPAKAACLSDAQAARERAEAAALK